MVIFAAQKIMYKYLQKKREAERERKRLAQAKTYAQAESIPPAMTAEQLMPTQAIPQASEATKQRAAQANIHAKPHPTQKGMWQVQIGSNLKWHDMDASEYELLAKRGLFKGYTESQIGQGPGAVAGAAAYPGEMGKNIQTLQSGREAVQKLVDTERAKLQVAEQNAETEEKREQYRQQLESMGNIDIDSLIASIPPATDVGGIIEAFTAQGLPVATLLAGLATVTTGGAAAPLLVPAVAYDMYGGAKKLEATSAISTGNEYYGKFMASRRTLENLEMDLRSGRQIRYKLSNGEVSSDPSEIYNDVVTQIVVADIVLKQMYDDKYFNIESNVGKQWQMVRGFIKEEPTYRQRFAEAYANPPMQGTPAYDIAQQAYAGSRASSGMTETE